MFIFSLGFSILAFGAYKCLLFAIIAKPELIVASNLVLLFISIILIISFVSYFFNWKADQSNISEILDRSVKAENYLGKIGASLSHFFIYKMFGIASFIIPIILSITSYYLLLEKKLFQLISNWSWAIVYMLWISIFTGFIQNISNVPSGRVGYEINMFLIDYIGNIGIALLLIFSGLSFIVIKLNITPKKSIDFINNFFKTKQLVQDEELPEPENVDDDFIENSNDEISIEIQDEISSFQKIVKVRISSKIGSLLNVFVIRDNNNE